MIVFNNSESVISLDPEVHVSIDVHRAVNLKKYATDEELSNGKRLKEFLSLGLLVPMRADANVFKVMNTVKRLQSFGHSAVFLPSSKNSIDIDTKSITRRQIELPEVENKEPVSALHNKQFIKDALQQIKEKPDKPVSGQVVRCKGIKSNGQPCSRKLCRRT